VFSFDIYSPSVLGFCPPQFLFEGTLGELKKSSGMTWQERWVVFLELSISEFYLVT
jgi:hypothetical protein